MKPQGRVGDISETTSDTHAHPCCAHICTGPAICGSEDVLVNGLPALRINDTGIHSTCCGANVWQATEGATGVLINDQRAHREGDRTQHCGGAGRLITGSPNVLIGDIGGSGDSSDSETFIEIELLDDSGFPVKAARFELELAGGHRLTGTLDDNGRARVDGISPGGGRVRFPDLADPVWGKVVS